MSFRVLHVLASAHLGGAEQMSLLLAEAHRRAGLDTAIHCFVEGAVTDSARQLQLHVSRPVRETPAAASRRQRWAAFAEGLRDAIAEFQPHVLQSHVPLTHLICHRVAPAAGIPWVATMHGSWRQFMYSPLTVARPYLRPYLLVRHAVGDLFTTRTAARVVAVSDYVRHEVLRIGVSPQRIVRIYNGLPTDFEPLPTTEGRRRLGIDEKQVVIGAMGHFAPVKGFDLLIKAYAPLASILPSATLLIAGGNVLGDTTVRTGLERWVSRCGLADRVRFEKPVSPREGFMSSVDIFVVSSRTEGFSLTLLEAMLHGKASVVTSAGGCIEVARPEKEGLVFHTGSVRRLTEAISRLAENPELRHRLGSAARERALHEFSLERCAEDYVRLYHEVRRR